MKKIVIIQSNYIPWKGYFDMNAALDEFILHEDMQYTQRDWYQSQEKIAQGVQCPIAVSKLKVVRHYGLETSGVYA